ncbi:hypothetical protein [Alteribacter aurantiacus]|uniref:hypothetical protein n=1 Tax=Alteribacter aurantiacus TaxID=254410 RepID=UPI0004021376|nr:hypothetical protein [Alteribacter aurantiacus]
MKRSTQLLTASLLSATVFAACSTQETSGEDEAENVNQIDNSDETDEDLEQGGFTDEEETYTLPDQQAIDNYEFELNERESEFELSLLVPAFLPHNFNSDNAMIILGSGHHSANLRVHEATVEDYLEEYELDEAKFKHMEYELDKSELPLTVTDINLNEYPPLNDVFDYYIVTTGHVTGSNLPVPNQFLDTDVVFHTLVKMEKDSRIVLTFNYEMDKETDTLVAEFLQIAQSIELDD